LLAQLILEAGREAHLLPCPKYFPSPLALNIDASGDAAGFEAIAYNMTDISLIFYTSDDQYKGPVGTGVGKRDDTVLIDQVIGATTAIVKCVVGSAMGALRWSMGRRKSDLPPMQINIDGGETEDTTMEDKLMMESIFFALCQEPAKLYASTEIQDSPRHCVSLVIDPRGEYAAASDTICRVMLLDLRAKQVIRMWKGVRDASCSWMIDDDNLYLAIHSRQRRSVELWDINRTERCFS